MRATQTLSICIAGATGWAGRAVAQGVLDAADLTLRSAVSRSAAGRDLGESLGRDSLQVPVYASARDALEGVDVLIDYTSVDVVKDNVLTAIAAGVAVVIATSGLTAADYEEIDNAARERSVGVVAAGNFSLTAAMCQAAAVLAARHLPHWEVIDYATATKPDAPSGTARELAERLGEVRPPAGPRSGGGGTRPGGGRGAPGPGGAAGAAGAGGRRPRLGGGGGRRGRGVAGALGPPAELRRFDRGRLRRRR